MTASHFTYEECKAQRDRHLLAQEDSSRFSAYTGMSIKQAQDVNDSVLLTGR
jgi:hypothetical protein